MSYYGSWKINDNLTFVANTHNPTNGAAVDADSVPSYHVYEDETATPLITGSMALLNGANTVGFYSEQIALTAANGFEKGKSYNIYIQAVVSSVTGTMAHNFQMEAEVDSNTVSDKAGYSLSSPQAFDLNGNITGTFTGNVLGSVQSVTNPVGINTGTFLDALADVVWDELLSGHLVPGSAGHTLFSRMPSGTVFVADKTGFSLASPQNFNLIGNITGTLVGNINGAVQSITNPVTVGTNNDKTGYSLSSPQNFDLIGNVSGTMTNVLNVVNPVTAGMVTGSVLGNVNGSVGSVVSPVGINTGTFIGAIADGVWDEAIAGHLSAGSTGEKLNSAASAGDPWTTALPGSYVSGQAGYILASRMPTGTVVVGTNNDKTGYSLSSPQNINIVGNITGTFTGNIVGNLSGSVGSLTDIASALGNKIADYVLRRAFGSARASSDGDAVSFRSLLGAVAKLVNRWNIAGTTLTVYAEDDATSLGTQALTGTAGADPITQVDTN